MLLILSPTAHSTARGKYSQLAGCEEVYIAQQILAVMVNSDEFLEWKWKSMYMYSSCEGASYTGHNFAVGELVYIRMYEVALRTFLSMYFGIRI